MKFKPGHRIRKIFYGIVMTGVTLSLCFAVGGSPAARAQEAWTATPSDIPTLEPTAVETAVELLPTQTALQPAMDFLSSPPSLSADGLTLTNAVAPLIMVVDPNPGMQGIKIPVAPALKNALADPAAATATFTFTFLAAGASDPWGQVCSTFPEAAKTAFAAAANIWANTIQSTIPIKIEACWASLSSTSILGYSGGATLYRDFSGAPQTHTWYESSLANALHGSDLGSSSFDDYITYNSRFTWYFGTDSNPPAGQYDLVTVATHEIAHGLNFSGSAQYTSGTGQYGNGGYPYIYDKFMEDSGGTKLTSYTSPSTALGTLLTSGSLWFDGTNANAANGGSRVRMYAPGSWSGGSSYSHLDYNTFAGTVNSMMVYAVGSGSANHNPGPVTKGILKDMGWVLPAGTSTLTVNKSGTGTGTVTSSPTGISCGSTCSYDFPTNTGVTLTAVATSPSTFSGWSGAGCSGTGTCTVTMSSAQTVTATFNPPPNQTLTVGKSGSGTGTVTSNPSGISCGSTCSYAFAYNTSVTLSAAATSPSTFGGWSGSSCSGTGTCTVTMSAARSVTATFNPPANQTLTVSKSGSGTGTVTSSPSGISCGSTCSFAFTYNTSVTLSAAATSPSTFGGWSGSSCSGTGACTVTMSAARSVIATFNPPPLTVVVQDVFTTDQNGAAASLGVGPQVVTGDGLIATPASVKTTFNPGDPIQLFIEVENQYSTDETATFQWIVLDPAGHAVPALQWSGDLSTPAGWADWLLPASIPADSLMGDYTFTGKITFNGSTTSASTSFHVNGHQRIANDYDGDGKTDPVKFAAGSGTVWWLKSSTGLWDGMWLGSDTFNYVGASDFDGDGKADPAKFYPATGTVWWINSSNGTLGGQWLGSDSFQYITGSDFDGDGKSDPAKFYTASGTVWWVNSSTHSLGGQWLGSDAFQYVPGSDFDGDGKTDPAKFYSSTGTVWWVRSSDGRLDGKWLGSDTFTYVPASDFDGDGKTDPAKFYPATGTVWWIRSTDGALDGAWLGSGTFTYLAGCDFNGDGGTDPAKYVSTTHTLSWLDTSSSIWTNLDMGTGTYTVVNGQ